MIKLLKVLELAIAAADLAARLRQAYQTQREQAERDHELTPEESAELDRRADASFAQAASHHSARNQA